MNEEGRRVKVKKRKAGPQSSAADGPAAADIPVEKGGTPDGTLAGETPDAGGPGPQGHPTTQNGDIGEPPEAAAGETDSPSEAGGTEPSGTPSQRTPLPTEEESHDEPAPSGTESQPPPGGSEAAGTDEDVPMMEVEEPPQSGESQAAPEALPSDSGAPEPVINEGTARPAGPEETELSRLKKEFSDRLFELELEKNRMEELGSELATRSEELERREVEVNQRSGAIEKRETDIADRHGRLERQETELSGKASQMKGRESELALQASALKKMEVELSKRHEMVSAGTEAMNALGEELRQKELKIKQSEEERARVRQELDAMKAELDSRQERMRSEMAALEQQKKEIEMLSADIQARGEALRLAETEHGKRNEQLERARHQAEDIESRLKERSEGLQRRLEEVQSLEQHIASIEDEIKLCPHCGAIEEYAHLAVRSEQLRAKGEDTRELNLLIKEARRAARDGDYEKAAARARTAADLIEVSERERQRREVMARIVAAESLARMLLEARADVSVMDGLLAEARSLYNSETMDKALEAAEKAHALGLTVERERFAALDELAASGSVIAALKKTGVNLHDAEKKKEEADAAMQAGDFKKARGLASETMTLASEVAQSQDVAGVMSQVRLADETLDELRSLGLDVSEWERMVNRSRDFLKKLDFKSAEETARWARQKGRDASRQYRHSLMAIDHSGSVISTYKDMGLIVRKAEDLQDEAKNRLKEGDTDLALNLARKAEKMVREIAERHKGAQAALKKALTTMRAERKTGRDITKGEKLYDLAQHQLELGEYANAMKLATKAAEAITSASVALLELCPTCGEAIPENLPECPSCAEKKRLRKDAAEKGSELAQRSRLGSKGGRKYACPYCSELFEITVATRPITINCPWCGHDVSVVD